MQETNNQLACNIRWTSHMTRTFVSATASESINCNLIVVRSKSYYVYHLCLQNFIIVLEYNRLMQYRLSIEFNNSKSLELAYEMQMIFIQQGIFNGHLLLSHQSRFFAVNMINAFHV